MCKLLLFITSLINTVTAESEKLEIEFGVIFTEILNFFLKI
jgi:hypothetical protein